MSIGADLAQRSLRGLGFAQWLSGDADAALASFQEAASTGGSEGLHLYDMMVIPLLKYLGRFDEIESILDNLREDGLIDSWVWHARYYYPSMRLFDRALSIIAEGLESDEVTYKEDLALRTATWHRQSGDLTSAESVLRRIEADLPRFYRGDHDLEWSFIKALRGDLPGALRFARSAFDKAIDYSDLNRYVTALAKLCYASGRIQDALDVLERANCFRDNTAAFYRRSQMAALTNSPDAESELRRVLLLATRGSRSDDWRTGQGTNRIYAALASARLGDPERARSEIEYAVKLEPERADIAYGAACAYALAGDTDKALDWLQTAVDRGHQELWWARVDPDLDNVRKLPRFKEITSDWEGRVRSLLD